MTKLDSILKSRDITLLTKIRLVKAMVFPVVMYGCESWTIKKAEWRRIDAFELWCWRRLLSFPWTARISNQSILKEISPGCSLEGLMLKLKLQYFGHLMRRVDLLEKTLMLGGIRGRRRRGWQRMRWLDGITDSMDMSLGKLWEFVNSTPGGLVCCTSWVHKELDMTEWLNWTEWWKKGFPDSWVGKESACNAGGPSLVPGSGRSAGEGIGYPLQYSWASLVAQLVKNPSAMQETWVQSLTWEDPLEKGKATHSSILAWRIGHNRELVTDRETCPWGRKESDVTELNRTEWLSLSLFNVWKKDKSWRS